LLDEGGVEVAGVQGDEADVGHGRAPLQGQGQQEGGRRVIRHRSIHIAKRDVRLSSPRIRPMTTPASPPSPPASETIGLLVETAPGPGVLHQLSGVIARHGADITLVEILENKPAGSRTYFEVAVTPDDKTLQQDLAALAIVRRVTVVKTFQRIYGKRIIIMGGGAQVGQVALGAISEADRHNIRGEHISVD